MKSIQIVLSKRYYFFYYLPNSIYALLLQRFANKYMDAAYDIHWILDLFSPLKWSL